MLIEAFEFQRGAGLGRNLTRLLEEGLAQCDRRLRVPAADPDETVHDVRKCLKELRALARLLRPELGARFTAANEALRDAGRLLSELRDVAALREAAAEVERTCDGAGERTVAARLVAAVGGSGPPARDAEALPSLAPVLHDELELAGRAFQPWPEPTDAVIREGFIRSYRTARRRLRDATGTRSDAALHELRKRTKDHLVHLEFLAAALAAPLDALCADARFVARLLGDDHDRVLLQGRLQTLPLSEEDREQAERLIAGQRVDLQERALTVGTLLLHDPPTERREWVSSLLAARDRG